MGRAGRAVTIYCPDEYTKAQHGAGDRIDRYRVDRRHEQMRSNENKERSKNIKQNHGHLPGKAAWAAMQRAQHSLDTLESQNLFQIVHVFSILFTSRDS